MEETGPEDIAGDFSQVKQLSLATTLRASFLYSMYSEFLQAFGPFLQSWLTIDHIQFYHCWVSRSIGSYPSNIFLLPLDYYQAEVADVFEDYHPKDLKPVNRINFVKRMWKYVHPASYRRHEVNMYKKNNGREKSSLLDSWAALGNSMFSNKRFFAFVPRIFFTTGFSQR